MSPPPWTGTLDQKPSNQYFKELFVFISEPSTHLNNQRSASEFHFSFFFRDLLCLFLLI